MRQCPHSNFMSPLFHSNRCMVFLILSKPPKFECFDIYIISCLSLTLNRWSLLIIADFRSEIIILLLTRSKSKYNVFSGLISPREYFCHPTSIFLNLAILQGMTSSIKGVLSSHTIGRLLRFFISSLISRFRDFICFIASLISLIASLIFLFASLILVIAT